MYYQPLSMDSFLPPNTYRRKIRAGCILFSLTSIKIIVPAPGRKPFLPFIFPLETPAE